MAISDSELQALLESLMSDTTQIISPPELLKELKQRNIPFKTVIRTPQQYIDDLFSERRKNALELLGRLPSPPSLAIPTITSLYDEIRECIVFGLNGAAITLSAILVEFTLKHAIAVHTTGKTVYDKYEWDRLENKELGPVITEAHTLGILTDEMRDDLHDFRRKMRNLYLHYNIKKITAGAVLRKAKIVDVTTGAIEERDLSAEDNPQIWQMAKRVIDRGTVLDVFEFTDLTVKGLLQD